MDFKHEMNTVFRRYIVILDKVFDSKTAATEIQWTEKAKKKQY